MTYQLIFVILKCLRFSKDIPVDPFSKKVIITLAFQQTSCVALKLVYSSFLIKTTFAINLYYL